jgi:nucleosome binding factor SPN SPT16 subunit
MNALLRRGIWRSIKASSEASVIREKKLIEQIASLKAHLAAKETERIFIVQSLHKMEMSMITISATLETLEK